MMNGFLERLRNPSYIARLGPDAIRDGNDYELSVVFDIFENAAYVKGGILSEVRVTTAHKNKLVQLIFDQQPLVHSVVWFHKGKPTCITRHEAARFAAA